MITEITNWFKNLFGDKPEISEYYNTNELTLTEKRCDTCNAICYIDKQGFYVCEKCIQRKINFISGKTKEYKIIREP